MPSDSRPLLPAVAPGLIRTAVIPAAGRGTRMRPVAGDLPKELLPLGGRTLIAHAIADLAEAHVERALLIVRPGTPAVRAALGDRVGSVALHWVEQERPIGLADALGLAEPFTNRAPFLCYLPDNVWRGPSMSAQIVAAHVQCPAATLVGLVELPAAALLNHGTTGFVESVPLAPLTPGVVLRQITRVLDKGTRPSAEEASCFKGFPLDLYQPDLFNRIRRWRSRPRAGEFDDTPLLQELAVEGRLVGVVLTGGTLFDCGIPSGYATARAAFGDH